MVKKKPDRIKEFIKEGEAELHTREKDLERKLAREMQIGKELIDDETEEFKRNVKKNPLEYVAGAFIVGLVIGKLLK
ncbi:MAG: hypothetical protein ABII71_02280 [Candidatus Micrarchaeota archaeon]